MSTVFWPNCLQRLEQKLSDQQLNTWIRPLQIKEDDNTITLLAPGAMIYSEYEFVIKSVEFSRDGDSETAVLKLVLPGSFSGEIPETLPWEE